MHKLVQWAVATVLALASPVVIALGLGGANVDSYLSQPLDVRVELISQSSTELDGITAGLASADDFEMLGLSRSAILVPLEFEIVRDTGRPHIRITSQAVVNEPVVQILVEVVWTNGRMLREYTLFLDPPTFQSAAPLPAVKPALRPAVPEKSPVKPEPVIVEPAPPVPEPVKQEPESITEEAEFAVAKPVSEVEEPDTDASPTSVEGPEEQQFIEDIAETGDASVDESTDEPADETADEPADKIADEPADDIADDAEGELADEPADEVADEPADELADQEYYELVDGEVYGPVARGETLWGIAREWSQGTGYSINQTMLALQRKNPDAFNRENINSLKRGAILRMPAYYELAELSSRDAMLEVLRQEEEHRTGIRTVAPEYAAPTIADSGDYQDSVSAALPELDFEEDTGHLELVPPAAEEDHKNPQVADQVQNQEVADQSVQEELARTEEELANARQENTYLQDRIAELEAQQQEKLLEVADAGLAGVESRLAGKRAEDKPAQPVALTPGGEGQPWYAGWTVWLIGTALLFIAFFVWILRRREAVQVEVVQAEEKEDVVKAVTGEAEDLLKILDRYEDSSADRAEAKSKVKATPQPEPEPESEPEAEAEPEVEAEAEAEAEADGEQVEETGKDGAETEDPEVKLDLARAYLSLGDKEAAKSMLDEVLSSGNAAQQAEARQMMEEL